MIGETLGRLKKPWWGALPDSELLDVRMCDLGVQVTTAPVQKRVDQLYDEIAKRGLRFRPTCWFSDEWFAPDRIPGIGIPFYMAHPRLATLERRQMLDVEGGVKWWCMQLLRHEAGHAIEAAFRLSRRKKWKELFGSARTPYPDYYKPKPFSRKHVIHLDWWYAQSHPTEDFAETFAVWLKPGRQWETRYRAWPALKKLRYVDELMKQLAGASPPVKSRATVDPLSRIRHTLRDHYEQKKARYGVDYPDFYDRDLRRLFSDNPVDRDYPTAASFLRQEAPELRSRIAEWTGEYAYTIDLVLKDMIQRCRELKLRAHRPRGPLRTELTVFLTMQTMSYLYSNNHRVIV